MAQFIWYALTSSNINRFSKLLHCQNQEKMRNNIITKEIVLFSVVALKTLDISQGSVATHLRCGGIFSDSIITHFLPILRMK